MRVFLDQLSLAQLEKLKQLSQGFLDTLTQERTSDLLFLGTSFADMDTEQRQRLGEQIMMMPSLAALPLSDIAFESNVYDNTKSQSKQKDLKPPNWNNSWDWRYPEANRPNAKPRWFDPNRASGDGMPLITGIILDIGIIIHGTSGILNGRIYIPIEPSGK